MFSIGSERIKTMKTIANRFFHGPDTNLGKWSMGLIVAMFVLFFIGTSFTYTLYASVPSGGTILQDIVARPALALTMLFGITTGILAFIVGAVAVAAKKERSVLVYISALIGMFLIIFLAGEFISHFCSSVVKSWKQSINCSG